MSIKDITDYVRLTPGNTNPSVIGSMVQSEVNGTLKESKAYTDQEVGNLKKSGGVGYTETIAPITFDGNLEGKEYVLENGAGNVKICDPLSEADFAKISSFTWVTPDGTTTFGDFTIYQLSDLAEEFADCEGQTLMPNGSSNGLMNIIKVGAALAEVGITRGLWVPYADGLWNKDSYVSRIDFTETIHTIDPKFIPAGVGGGLPVVELTTQPEDADSFGLNAEENAQLDALNGMPFVLKCTGLVGGKRPYHICAIANHCEYPQYDYYGYEAVTDSAVFTISRTSSGWRIQFKFKSI